MAIVRTVLPAVVGTVRGGVASDGGLAWGGGGGSPTPFAAPTISGTPGIIGGALTCTPSASYQWKRDGVSIGGATAPTYAMVAGDQGPALTCVTPKGTSNSLAYVPTADVIDWLDPATLTPGLVASWVGTATVLTETAAGAARPTASATSMNSTPGNTGNGTANVMSGAINLSGGTSCRLVFAGVDTATTIAGVFAYGGAVGAVPGAFDVYVNDPASGVGSVSVYCRGATGLGGAGTAAASIPLSSATVVSVCPDTTVTNGTKFIRANGVAKALTDISILADSNPLANSSLVLFRDEAVTFWAGTFGVVAVMSGNAQDTALDRVERFCAYRAGIATW